MLLTSHGHRLPDLQTRERRAADVLCGIAPSTRVLESGVEKSSQAQEGRDCKEGFLSSDTPRTCRQVS